MKAYRSPEVHGELWELTRVQVWMLVALWNTMHETQVQAGQRWMLVTELADGTDVALECSEMAQRSG